MKSFLLCLFAAACCFPAASQWKGFSSITGYPVKKQANIIHVKDLTADGMADIMTLYTASDLEYGLLQGNDKGQFLPERHFAKADNYSPSDLADLNGDGFIDLVISSYWNNGLMIYFGNGSGAFSNGTFMATGVHGREVKCTDINKDGKTDIIAATSGSGQPIYLHVFIGRGDGSFLPKQSYRSLLDTSKEIFITDKNNDGLPDIIIASSFPWVLIWYQQPDGSFTDRYIYTQTLARVGIADCNQDGREDLLLSYSSFDNDPGADSLLIRLNNGDTSFAASIPVHFPGSGTVRPYKVKLIDINKDNYTDIILSQVGAEGNFVDSLYYATGGPNLSFSELTAIPFPAPVNEFALADVNADGAEDLVVACTNSYLYVALNDQSIDRNPVTDIKVFPNPASSFVKIRDPKARFKSITLYNAVGQQLQHLNSSGLITTLPTQHLPAGTYFLHIRTNAEERTIAFQNR